jgi:hypothetical protein
MDSQISVWSIFGYFVAVITIIPIIFQIIRKTWNLLYEILSFRNLKIRSIGRKSYSGIPHVEIKIALTGNDNLIVDEVDIQSKLSYPRRIEGLLAWLQLGIGYFLDDIEGLNNVLGRSFPNIIWIPSFPFHRIHNSYIRKPLNIILGLVTFYYFIIFLIPIFWPFLFIGPYWELKMFSGNEKIKLLEIDSKTELKRPFILKSGIENNFTISYQPSLYLTTLLMTRLYVENTKISYVKEPPRLRTIKLPRNKEFIWKVTDILRVRVSGKMKRYFVKLGVSYVNIQQ